MAFTMAILVKGEKATGLMLNRLAEDIGDARVPLNRVYEDWKKANARNINAGGWPVKFTPLSPSYARRKARVVASSRIMVASGRLFNALTRDSGDTIKKIKKHFGVFGVDLPYDRRHQFGTFGMPQRKFMQYSDHTRIGWATIFQEWVHEKEKGAKV